MELNEEGKRWIRSLRKSLVHSIWFTCLSFVFINSLFAYIGLYKNGLIIIVGAVVVTVTFFTNRVLEIIKNVRAINQFVGEFELNERGLTLTAFQIVIKKLKIELEERTYHVSDKHFKLKEEYENKLGEVYQFRSENGLVLKIIHSFFNVGDDTWSLVLSPFRKGN